MLIFSSDAQLCKIKRNVLSGFYVMSEDLKLLKKYLAEGKMCFFKKYVVV